MADKPKENPSDNHATVADAASIAARSKTLLISIITFAILIGFALWTLFRTDFKTYPGSDDVDIIEITRVPEALQDDDDNDASVEETEVVAAQPLPSSLQELLAAAEPADSSRVQPQAASEPAAPLVDLKSAIEEAIAPLHRELAAIKSDFEILEKQLDQRELEIARLHQELEIARTPQPIAEAAEEVATEENAQDLETLQELNEQLRQHHLRLETQLAESRQRLKEAQDALQQSDAKVHDADARVRDLTKRQEELLRRLDAVVRERTQFEDKMTQQQAKLVAQERSFQELSNALKSHKQALRQMDQARMELAAELDSTKNQYAKLVSAIASQGKELTLASSPRAVETVEESFSTAPVPEDRQEVRYHVVGKGDTLTSISRHYYGTAQRWNEIYEANKAVLSDHNRLKVGLIIVIP